MRRTTMNEPDLSGRHILIIEDEHIVAQAMCRMLRVWGATVVGPAATVDSALALVRSGPRIDGVLLDINLRGVRAFSVADELIERKHSARFRDRLQRPDDSGAIPARRRVAEAIRARGRRARIVSNRRRQSFRARFPVNSRAPSGQWCRRSNETGYES